MPSAARRLDLRTLRAAAVTGAGAVVPLSSLEIGTLTWPWEHAHRVLHEWRAWTASAADVTSAARLVRPPRGRPTVSVELAIAGGSAGRLAPLRRLAPALDTVRVASPAVLRPPVARVPAGLTPITTHLRLRRLPGAAIDAFVAAAGPGSGSELLAAELHHLGGAYVLAATGAAVDSDQGERVRIGLAQLERRLAQFAGR